MEEKQLSGLKEKEQCIVPAFIHVSQVIENSLAHQDFYLFIPPHCYVA